MRLVRKRSRTKFSRKNQKTLVFALMIAVIASIAFCGPSAQDMISGMFREPAKEPVFELSVPELVSHSDLLYPLVSAFTKEKPSYFRLYINGEEFPGSASTIECSDFENSPGYCTEAMLLVLEREGWNTIKVEAQIGSRRFSETRKAYNDIKLPEISGLEFSESKDYYIISGHASDDYGVSETFSCIELMPDGSGKSLNVQTSFADGDFEIKIPKPEASSPENILCGTFDEAGNPAEFTSGLKTLGEIQEERWELFSELVKKGSVPPPGKMSGSGEECEIVVGNIIIPYGTDPVSGNKAEWEGRHQEFFGHDYLQDAINILYDKITVDNGYCDVVLDDNYKIQLVDMVIDEGKYAGLSPFVVINYAGGYYLSFTDIVQFYDTLLTAWLNEKMHGLEGEPSEHGFPILLVDEMIKSKGITHSCPDGNNWKCGLLVLSMHSWELENLDPKYAAAWRFMNKRSLSHEILHEYAVGHSQKMNHLMYDSINTSSKYLYDFDVPENQACAFASHWGEHTLDFAGGSYSVVDNPGVFKTYKTGIGPEGFKCADNLVNWLSLDRELTEFEYLMAYVDYPSPGGGMEIKRHCIDCSVKPLPELSVNMISDLFGEKTDEPCQCYESDYCFLSTPEYPQCGGSCPDGSSCGTDEMNGLCICKPNCEGQSSHCGDNYWCPSDNDCVASSKGCECTPCDPINNNLHQCATDDDCFILDYCDKATCTCKINLEEPGKGPEQKEPSSGECGDGNKDPGEECEDDGHCEKGEECLPPGSAGECTCQKLCGNGHKDDGEDCESNEHCEDGEKCLPPGDAHECMCEQMECDDPTPSWGANGECKDRKPCPLAECVENGGKCTCCGNEQTENEEECDGEDPSGLEDCQNSPNAPDDYDYVECDDECKCIYGKGPEEL